MAPRNYASVRPENVLKRAEDLIGVNQQDAALQTLYELLTAKRTRYITPSELEPVALQFVELCVEMRDGRTVRDGLHQYRRLVHNSSNEVRSLARVVDRFLAISEEKLVKAKEEEAANIGEDELEEERTPESILMSAVSASENDGAFVTPWLRFVWEGYRTVLDLLRNHSVLEEEYHSVCSRALKFTLNYSRRSEFRKLAEMLRIHLLQIQTAQGEPSYQAPFPVNLSKADTLQRFLELRFRLLNTAVQLEQWQEAFRAVEAVHTLISVSKRQPSPHMMLNYFQNLARIFSVGENPLFHAAAVARFFSLFGQSPLATEEELQKHASVLLVSTLAIPQHASPPPPGTKLAVLLGLPQGNSPSRESLIRNVLDRNVLAGVDPSLRDLYSLLEREFHPLSFADRVAPAVAYIKASPHLQHYARPLAKAFLGRLFQQLSKVYSSVKLEFVVRLGQFGGGEFGLSPLEIEAELVAAARRGIVFVKIDHSSKTVVFRSDLETGAGAASLVKNNLSGFGEVLCRVSGVVDPVQKKVAEPVSIPEASGDSLLDRYLTLKERNAKFLEAREAELEAEAKAMAEQTAAARKADQERIEAEQKKRALEKQERQRREVFNAEKQKVIDQINNKGIIKVQVDNLDDIDTEQLKRMQIEQLAKEQKELSEKLHQLDRRNDHLERAFRKYEIPLLVKDSEAQIAHDEQEYRAACDKVVANAKLEHKASLQARKRFGRMLPDLKEFIEPVKAVHDGETQARVAAVRAEFEKAKQERIVQVVAERRSELEARRKEEERVAAEKAMAEEAERAEREKEALREKEQEQKVAQSQLAAQQQEEAKRRREESVRLQREAEAEVARKIAAQRAKPVPAPAQAPPSDPSKPLTMRERLRLKREGKIP